MRKLLFGVTALSELFMLYHLYTQAIDKESVIVYAISMFVGLVFIALTLKEEADNDKAKLCLYRGGEKHFLILHQVVLSGVAIASGFGLLHGDVHSYILTCFWSLPLASYFVFKLAIICTKKSIRINNREMEYRDINKLVVENEKKLTIKTKQKDYSFPLTPVLMEKVIRHLLEENSRIEVERK